jgi:hypothetical protein
MLAIVYLLAASVANLFKSDGGLRPKSSFSVIKSISPGRRPARFLLRGSDRALLVWMTRLWPRLLGMARVVEPATILRWRRAGFVALNNYDFRADRRGDDAVAHAAESPHTAVEQMSDRSSAGFRTLDAVMGPGPSDRRQLRTHQRKSSMNQEITNGPIL